MGYSKGILAEGNYSWPIDIMVDKTLSNDITVSDMTIEWSRYSQYIITVSKEPDNTLLAQIVSQLSCLRMLVVIKMPFSCPDHR